MAVLFLNIHHVFIERVGVDKVRGLDPVQDHVHDPDDVGEALLLLSVEGFGLQGLELGRGQIVGAHVVVGFAEEARRADSAVINRLADFGVGDLNHGADERTWRVIFAPVAARVAHAADAGFVELRQFVAFGLSVEGQPVHGLQHVAQDVAGAELVAQLGEDLTDLVLNGIGTDRRLAEGCKVGEQLLIDEFDQVVANAGRVVVKLAIGLGCGPVVPAEGPVDDRGIVVTFEFGAVPAFCLQVMQVLEEQDP